MGSFMTQVAEPVLYEDKVAVLSVPQGLTEVNVPRAVDFNAIQSALLDARAAYRGLRFYLEDFGAVVSNRYCASADAAWLAARAAAEAAQGGIITGTPGVLFDFEDTAVLGVPFVDPDDIQGDASFATAPSYDPAAFNLARQAVPVSFDGQGCYIRGNWDSSVGKAIFADFIADGHAKPNQDKHFVRGVTIVGRDGFTQANPPVAQFSGARGALAADNHQVGYFSVLSSALLESVSVRECDRGAVLSDCYSSLRLNITAAHCNRLWAFYADNASISINVKALLAETLALDMTGQRPTVIGFTTEQCKVDLQVTNCDGGALLAAYMENTTPGDTDFGVKFGDTTDATASQVINFTLDGGHLFRQYGKPIRWHSAVYQVCRGFRSYTTGGVVNNSGCGILIEGYPMDITPSANATEAVTQFCPGQPNGTLQLGGSTGVQLKLGDSARLAWGANGYLTADTAGGGRIYTLANFYVGGNIELAGGLYLGNGTVAGNGTATGVLNNNFADSLGTAIKAWQVIAPPVLVNAASVVLEVRHGGNSGATFNQDGSLELKDLAAGYIRKSPDGTRWRIDVSNVGALSATPL